jgi:hypothetical protein
VRLGWAARALAMQGSFDLRARMLAATIAIHAGLLAFLLSAHRETQSVAFSSPMSTIDLAAPPGPAQPAKPPQPKPVPPTPPQPVVVPPPVVPLPLPSDMAVALLDQSVMQATGGACDLTAPVQEALRTSEAVQAALPMLPRPSRSVANAVMIWDANWVAFADAPDLSVRDTIRDAIAGTVAVASEECRLQMQGGPRLLILPLGDTQTIVLALGSGQWRWQDLLDTARPDGWVMAGSGPENLYSVARASVTRPAT